MGISHHIIHVPWFYRDFPMIFPWFSHDPMDFPAPKCWLRPVARSLRQVLHPGLLGAPVFSRQCDEEKNGLKHQESATICQMNEYILKICVWMTIRLLVWLLAWFIILYSMHMVKSGNIKIRTVSQARSQPVFSAPGFTPTLFNFIKSRYRFVCSRYRFPWFARHFQPYDFSCTWIGNRSLLIWCRNYVMNKWINLDKLLKN